MAKKFSTPFSGAADEDIGGDIAAAAGSAFPEDQMETMREASRDYAAGHSHMNAPSHDGHTPMATTEQHGHMPMHRMKRG